MQEAIKKLYDAYGIDANTFATILGLKEEDILENQYTQEDETRIHALINGFSIMDYQVEEDAILQAILEKFTIQYGISIQGLSKLLHVSHAQLQAFYEKKQVSLDIKYTIACRLFRLANAVFPLDHRHIER